MKKINNDINRKEVSNNKISKENFIESNFLSFKYDKMSSEFAKIPFFTSNNNDSNNNNINVNDKKEKNINFNNSINNNNNYIKIDLLNSIYKRAKSQNTFFDKLHNELIKNEIKVVILLNHGMKF